MQSSCFSLGNVGQEAMWKNWSQGVDPEFLCAQALQPKEKMGGHGQWNWSAAPIELQTDPPTCAGKIAFSPKHKKTNNACLWFEQTTFSNLRSCRNTETAIELDHRSGENAQTTRKTQSFSAKSVPYSSCPTRNKSSRMEEGVSEADPGFWSGGRAEFWAQNVLKKELSP